MLFTDRSLLHRFFELTVIYLAARCTGESIGEDDLIGKRVVGQVIRAEAHDILREIIGRCNSDVELHNGSWVIHTLFIGNTDNTAHTNIGIFVDDFFDTNGEQLGDVAVLALRHQDTLDASRDAQNASLVQTAEVAGM